MLLSEDTKLNPKQEFFVRMLSFCVLLMLILLAFEFFGTTDSPMKLKIEIGVSVAMLLLLRFFGQYTIVLIAALLSVYLSIFTIPVQSGSVLGGAIGIIAIFLIIHYSSSSHLFLTINRILFAIAMIGYYHFLGEEVLVKNHFWYDMLSILVASAAVLLTTYFYEKKIDRYRLKLQASNDFLKDITDLNPQLIFTKDQKYRFTFVNQAMAKAMGRSKDDFYNKTDRELGIPEEEALRYETGDKQVLTQGTTISLPINRFDSHGHPRWYETIKKPIYQNQQIIGLLGVTTDITNLKEKESEILAAKKKAEESDSLKSAFLANMSHEIRTPMNSIIGFSELLLNEKVAIKERREYTTIINQNCKQLLQLVSNILDISKLETEQVRVIEHTLDVHKLLRGLHASFLPLATEKKLAFRLILGEKSKNVFFKTDIQKVRQILKNLISNAIKYTNTGSVEFGYKCYAHKIQFYVKDTGIGIEKIAQQAVFERFQRTDESMVGYSGTGLGLAISKGFANLLNGEIQLQSELGKGTVFYLDLPYKALEGMASAIDKNKNKFVTSNKKMVLIAEDGQFNALLIKRLLSSQQIRSIHAQNGAEAVELVKSEIDKIALVLMDIKMPIMDGKTASRIIKQLYPDLPIIAQTGLGKNDKSIMENFDGVIQKPINKKALLKILEQYIPATSPQHFK